MKEFLGNFTEEELNKKFETKSQRSHIETGSPKAATWQLEENLTTQGKVGAYKVIGEPSDAQPD